MPGDSGRGEMTLPTRGLNYSVQGTVITKNFRKKNFPPSDGGYSPIALPWRHPASSGASALTLRNNTTPTIEVFSVLLQNHLFTSNTQHIPIVPNGVSFSRSKRRSLCVRNARNESVPDMDNKNYYESYHH